MKLENYNDKTLLAETLKASRAEKMATVNLLKHLQEINRRKLFVDLGHSTLNNYTTKELGYSESEAWTRIQAMRLLQTAPQIEEKIEAGLLSLCNAATVQSHIVDQGIQKLPQKVAEAIQLAVELPNRRLKQVLKPKAEDEVKVTLKGKLLEKFKKLQAQMDELSELEIIEALVEEKLKNSPPHPKVTTAQYSSTKTRYLPVQTRRATLERSGHQCEHKNKDGTRCPQRRNLQFDHLQPFALGGSRSPDNIQLLCFNHNQHRSIKTFGMRLT